MNALGDTPNRLPPEYKTRAPKAACGVGTDLPLPRLRGDATARGEPQESSLRCSDGPANHSLETARCNVWDRLQQLRTELADLAFTLESQGRLDAADLATSVARRLSELQDPDSWSATSEAV